MMNMKVLAVDTATESCSVAIIDDARLLAELTVAGAQSHSKHLMDLIDAVCGISAVKVSDVEGFAVTIGPGSFTGLRIGISAIKGLAFSLAKPVVGVSSLDALAWQCAPSDYLLCPILDARKQEVYFCRYRFENGELKKLGSEQVAPPDEAVRGLGEACLFVGNGAHKYHWKIAAALGEFANFASVIQNNIRASATAFIGLQRFHRRETDDASTLVPHYIRKSDAQIRSSPKYNPLKFNGHS